MLLAVPDVLNAEQVLKARQILEQAEWVDGRVTAGHQSSRVKDNLQLAEGSPAAKPGVGHRGGRGPQGGQCRTAPGGR